MTQRPQRALDIPLDSKDVPHFLKVFLPQLYTRLNELESNLTETANAAPDKPTQGMIKFADGTNWNPGSGAGLYQYRSGVWVFIG